MAQKTEVEIGVRDKATGELNGIRGAFEKFRVSVETNNKGINKLDNALRGMGAQAASLPGPLGRVADALADFAPGGLAGAAYLAGFGSMILITKSYFDAAERTKKINEELAQTIADIEGKGKQFRLSQLHEELRKLGEESESGWKKFWYGSDGRLFGFGLSWDDQRNQLETEIKKTADVIARELDAAQQRVRDTAGDVSLARAEARGMGLQERVRQTETALVVAQNALAVAEKERKTQADIANLKANVNVAEAAHIRAIAALRDAENKKTEQALNDQIAKQKKRAEALAKIEKETLDELFAINMKYYEDLADARQLSRQFISEDIGNQLKVNLGDVDKTILGIEEAAKKAQTAADERMKSIEPIVYGISDGFDTMIDGLLSGENAFKSFGQGARSAISGILKALAQQNLVEGLGALGKAFAAAANPLTAPSAPGFFKSAAQHFAAAAAAGVGARAVGGAGGGGIGANGGAFNNSQLGRNNFNTQQPLTIVVQGGLLDMSNPDTQRSFVGALETISNRRVKFNMVGA